MMQAMQRQICTDSNRRMGKKCKMKFFTAFKLGHFFK